MSLSTGVTARCLRAVGLLVLTPTTARAFCDCFAAGGLGLRTAGVAFCPHFDCKVLAMMHCLGTL